MADIFFSYTRADRVRIVPLIQSLKAQGWNVWWDSDIQSGDRWNNMIESELTQARCVIVAWSTLSVKSRWVKEEARVADETGKILPVLLDPVRPPLGLGDIQAEDLSRWRGGSDEPEFQRLLNAIHAKLDTIAPARPPAMFVMSEEERLLASYREAGRSLVALNLPAADPVQEATILPRERAFDMITQALERNKLSISLEQMTTRLAIIMASRATEELVFGRERVTTGTAGDLEDATRLARLMVTRWGLSSKLGFVAYGESPEQVLPGHPTAQISEAAAQKIDAEVKRLVGGGYRNAKRVLVKKLDDLHVLARGLYEYETLSGEEIVDLLWGRRPRREPVT